MSKHLVEFPLSLEETDGSILIEINEPEKGGMQRVSLKPGDLAHKAKQSFEAAIEHVKPAIVKIVMKLRDMPERPNEMQVKFGLKMNMEAGAVIASTSGEANFEVTLKWTQP